MDYDPKKNPVIEDAEPLNYNCSLEDLVSLHHTLFVFFFLLIILLKPYVSCASCYLNGGRCHTRGGKNSCYKCGANRIAHCTFNQDSDERNLERDRMHVLGLSGPESKSPLF